MSILKNIQAVEQTVAHHAKKAGHQPEDICTVAVSKTCTEQQIKDAYDAGIRHFGENRVQEFREKYEHLEKNIAWHIIGRLQKNKVKYIIGKTTLIQSLSSVSLAKEIERRSEKSGVVTDCLVQVNIGNEASKSGVGQEELHRFLEELSYYRHLRVRGLMAMAPFLANKEETRPYFARMKQLYDAMPTGENIQNKWLSMGMSQDYSVALEEGANMIRVGSSIFGVRI